MNNRVNKIIKDEFEEIDQWIDTFFSSIYKISENDFENQDVRNFFNSATELLLNVSKKSRIRDKFVPYYYKPSLTLICLLKSEKTECEYNLMYDRYNNEIVFNTDLRNWENIRNIKDSFWTELLDAANKHDIQFSSHSGPFYETDKTPEFNANYKSILFNLMSVYITAMLEPEKERQNISFGQLEIVWSIYDKCIADMMTELEIAFKLFYRFNYLLWKSEDVRKQNRENRRKRELQKRK
ncbi:hypothetical protein M0G43_12105 [Subsaxibacter sp. CAU 1640]|uniref:hypothetical protein n=1 Tax=Subsaxibacter sp. CAU 1640 TaxID=2933271 RepID=UPI002002D7EB|nr:hypothetical protein [Subsaxibacter sp. CAU 1640]MCK7591321.1 hypothetical protein [Subsaxibacter sp. CAU 1640]